MHSVTIAWILCKIIHGISCSDLYKRVKKKKAILKKVLSILEYEYLGEAIKFDKIIEIIFIIWFHISFWFKIGIPLIFQTKK